MDLFQDFRDLLEAFAARGVRFVLLGGYAVAFHGRPRATKDIDLLVDLASDNLEQLAAALLDFGAPAGVVDGARRLTPDQVVYFGVSPLRVDILGSASGIEFGPVFQRAVTTTLSGVSVRVISIDDLIVNKNAAGRPVDLQDAKELERLRATRV